MKAKRLFQFFVLTLFAVAVFAACSPKTHTITFDPNNGSSVTTQQVVNGSAVTQPSNPSKPHYTFVYWYATNPEVPYPFSSAVTSSFSLTAKYDPILFTATYNPNNGQSATQVSVQSGSTLTEPTAPIKPHYTFEYWYTTNEEVPYSFSTTITQSFQLYAKYTKTIFQVTFDPNNGEAINSVSVESNELVAIPAAPMKAHHVFAYWYSSNPSTPFDFDAPILQVTNLTAKYDPIMFTLTYHPQNGGDNIEVSIQSGTTITPPPNPIKEHYDFAYWYQTDDAVAFDFSVPMSGDLVLLAKFTRRQYTITFNPNNGQSSWQVTVPSGDVVTQPSEDPTRPDQGSTIYTFEYWYKEGQINQAYNFSQPVTTSFTILARYLGTVTYQVTFEPSNGEDSWQQRVNEGDLIDRPENPMKTHYTFVHWYSGDDSIPFDFATTLVTSNITLSAKFVKTEFNVTFIKDNGEENDIIPVYANDKVIPPANPIKTGTDDIIYTFIGWFVQGGETVFDFDQAILGSFSLYAHYQIQYRVQYFVDGVLFDTQWVIYEEQTSAPQAPVKDHYTFQHWYLTDFEVGFNLNQAITGPKTLNAHYEVITYTITFEPENGEASWQVVVTSGQSVNAPSQNPEKADEGITSYTFAYWYTTDPLVAYIFSDSVLSSFTLYAKYTSEDQMDANILAAKPSWTDYKDNISTIDKDEFTLFTGENKNYIVGTSNAFILPIEAIYVDYNEGNPIDYTLTRYNRTIQLYVKNHLGEWEVVSDVSLYLQFDAYHSGIVTFLNGAIGKVFKLVVYLNNDPDERVVLESIEVASGYNLYNEADLMAATEYAVSGSAAGGVVISSRKTIQSTQFFLHNNIVITSASLPTDLLEVNPPLEAGGVYSGTYLVDGSVLFVFLGNDDQFRFNGNFYAIDGSLVPLVVRDDASNFATPETAFGVNAALITVKEYANAIIENVTIIGNSRYSADKEDKGGYISMYLAANIESNLENVHMRYAQTALVPTKGIRSDYPQVNINHSVFNNMFSLGIYNDSCHIDIKNSIFKTFGGMAIAMADYANNPTPSEGSRPNPTPMILTIDDQSQIVSNIVGNEAWFTINNLATVAMPLKGQIEAVVNNFGKSVLNPNVSGEYINFIAIVTVEAPVDPAWAGCHAFANVSIDSSVVFYQNPFNDPEYGPLTPTIYEGFAQAGGMLKTSAGGLIYDYQTFNTNFNNFMLMAPEQVQPYIASLPGNAQQALFEQLTIFDVMAAQAAMTLQSDPMNVDAWTLLASMPAKVLDTYQKTILPASQGNNYLFVKTKIGTSWVGILVEMFDVAP